MIAKSRRSRSLKPALSHHLPAAAWALACAALLLAPGSELPEVAALPWLDKAAHLVLFLVLALLAARSCRLWARRPMTVAALASLAYAVVLEAAQTAVPGRGWETADLAAAAAGVLVGALAAGRAAGRRAAARD